MSYEGRVMYGGDGEFGVYGSIVCVCVLGSVLRFLMKHLMSIYLME